MLLKIGRSLRNAKKLIKKDSSGQVTRWGIEIPSTDFRYWMFQALALENESIMKNKTNNRFEYLLLLPYFIFLFIFTIYLIIKSIIMSFFQKNMGAENSTFVWLINYKKLMALYTWSFMVLAITLVYYNSL